MFQKNFLERFNRIDLKILAPFLFLIMLFAVTEIIATNERISKDLDTRTRRLLQNHSRLLTELIKEQEDKVAFYAQFMADIRKLSEELTDTRAGRSVMIYFLETLKKERIRIHLYRERSMEVAKRGLIRKGLLGIRTTALVTDDEGSELALAAVAPLERTSGVSEVIVAEFPLDDRFLGTVKRKTEADISIIYREKLFASTLPSALQRQAILSALSSGRGEGRLAAGKNIVREISLEGIPHMVSFGPISVNYKYEGVYAISKSLKQGLINKKAVLVQNILIVVAILVGVVAFYYILVRRFTQPIKALRSATREVAAGNLRISTQVKTGDELGELGRSFNRMVEQLRQSEQRLKSQMEEVSRLYREVSEERNITKSILDNLSSGVILFDPEHRVALINPIAERWLGVKSEQVKGLQIAGEPESDQLNPLYKLASLPFSEEMVRCWKHFNCTKRECPAHGNRDLRCWFISGTYCRNEVAEKYPEKLEGCRECEVYKGYRSALKEQKTVKIEEIELTKPQRRLLKVFISPVFDDHGRFLGLINVLNDITAEREVDRLKTEFLSLVSHELRTPLSSIKAYIEILMRRPDRKRTQQVEFLQIINEETDRLTRLINDILNITRIEERGIDLDRKSMDIGQLLERSVSAQRSSAQKKGITMSMEIQGDLPCVMGDEDTLMQVMTNLLSNAIKYTPEGGSIKVTAHPPGDEARPDKEVTIKVADTGMGIPSEDLTKVFDKFYRIDRPFIKGEKGTGLGLYFCKYIIERHGGRIWAESEEGRGSTFIFTLPVSEQPADDKAVYELQAEELIKHPKAAREKVSVLIVDDEKRVRQFLRYHMEEEGFEVYEAEEGRMALEMTRKVNPDVILLDAVMPGLDGYDVIQALSEDRFTRRIPVIFLSGSEDSRLAMELGAAKYLLKPIDRETLIKAVNEILNAAFSDKKHAGSLEDAEETRDTTV